ncbi:MAG: M48 family metalloprotease [Firmicutes bacterium]|nr:M48 family metalloprotease [Bacillota bacterium]
MILKSGFIIYLIVSEIYTILLNKVRDAYRKRPLPKEVADIYDAKRYQDFLNYKSDYRKLSNVSTLITSGINLFVIFSPFFQWMEKLGNPYIVLLVTILILNCISHIQTYFISHYATFVIEEKYEMNKKTQKEFNKDFFLETILDLGMEIVLYGIIVYICEHITHWTNNFQISYLQSFLFVTGILAVMGILVFAFMGLSVLVLFKQYTFTNLEDEELLNEINRMRKGVKKKIRGIKVYDESKKSTTKNAFVLNFPLYRIVGIADNFLNENSKRELYGVLAHEIGHLKHKKNIWNYIKYIFTICLAIVLIWLIPNGMLIKNVTIWINSQFGLNSTCYYLYFMIIGILMEPIGFVLTVYNNFATRIEEYEADQNAVKEGYGEDLIRLFKELSRDELVDVNPSPIIEFLEYDHPGMYQRILGLQGKR